MTNVGGRGSIPGRGGDFSPLICGTGFRTGCRGFYPGTPVSYLLPSPLYYVTVHSPARSKVQIIIHIITEG